MYVETIAFHGLPPRGSAQDRLACETLARARNRKLCENVYLGRLLAATVNLDENIFQLWTELYSLEIFQNAYTPATVSSKASALKTLNKRLQGDSADQKRMFQKLRQLTVRETDMRPLTARELEAARRKLRRRALVKATK